MNWDARSADLQSAGARLGSLLRTASPRSGWWGAFLSFLGSHCLAVGFGLGCLALGTTGQAAVPTLSWAVTADVLELRWRAADGAFLLEESPTIAAGANWSVVVAPPKEVGPEFVAAVPVRATSRFFRLRDAPLTTVQETSPANGETGVAVTRETVLRLSSPLAVETTLGPEQLFAEFGGRRILSRVEVASDRMTATLFYLENLPGNARIRVTLQDDALRDLFGRLVDADGDGQPGGTRVIDFDTQSLAPVPATAVVGRVFASELVPGLSESQTLNTPLAGVTITLDGMEETIRTTTDAQGNFKLAPVPAGRFFVHADGRTVTNLMAGIHYPDQAYYPFIGKAWEAIAGREDNLAGGNGEIYLPLVLPGTLQTVSATSDTPITFAPAVLERNPELAGVSITVPANSLLSENGTRGGRVGIAPVSPSRLPEPLPPDLDFPLVITIQTDGPANFDRPVPVRFPNLPDRETGQPLPPGAKSALWSFNHDTGNWEIGGPMTVSADGEFVETDPGVGAKQPGWHATTPGTQGNGGRGNRGRCRDRGCLMAPIIFLSDDGEGSVSLEAGAHTQGVVTWSALDGIPSVGMGDRFTTTFCSPGPTVITAKIKSNCGQQECTQDFPYLVSASTPCPSAGLFSNPATVYAKQEVGFGAPYVRDWASVSWSVSPPQSVYLPAPNDRTFNGVFCSAGNYTITARVTRLCGNVCTYTKPVSVIDLPAGSPVKTCWIGAVPLYSTPALVGAPIEFRVPGHFPGTLAWSAPAGTPNSGSGRTFVTTFSSAQTQTSVTVTLTTVCNETCSETFLLDIGPPWPSPLLPTASELPLAPNTGSHDPALGGVKGIPPATAWPREFGSTPTTLGGAWLRAQFASSLATDEQVPRSRSVSLHDNGEEEPLTGLLYFAIVNLQNDRVIRGKAGSEGILHSRGIGLAPRAPYREYVLEAATLHVGSAEFTSAPIGQRFEMPIVQVNAKDDADADGDGLSDLGELVMGTNANQADTDGDGVGDGAEVQSGGDPLSGIAVRTGVIAAAATPGPAVDVSAANDLAAVACKDYGLVLFNVFSGLDPVRIGQVETPGEALRVATAGTVAAVADGAKGLAIIDLSDPPAARIRHQVNLGAPVVSVALGAGVTFAGSGQGGLSLVDLATGSRLAGTTLEGGIIDLIPLGDFVCAVTPGKLHVLAAAQGTLAPVGAVDLANTERPLRLFAADGSVFVVHRNGVGAYAVTGGVPTFLQTLLTEPMPIPDIGWEHLVLNGSGVSLAAISQPSAPPPPGLRIYDLPAPAGPMTLIGNLDHQGIARAASIYNGIAYVAADIGGLQVVNYLPRDIGSQAPSLALSASFPLEAAAVEEGQTARVTAQVSDDVQVRNVTYFLNGVAVATDGNYPFEHRFVTPLRTEQSSFTIAAVATDTGGNITRSAPITVTVTADTAAPQIVAVAPADGATLVSARSLAVFFNEPIATASLTADQWRLWEAGPDAQLDTVDDVEVGGGVVEPRPEILATLFSFPNDLPPGAYRAQLQPGVRDLAGNVRGAPHAWSFILVGVPPTAGPKLATGSGHTLVIEPDGSLWGWGNNYNGQIGDGGPQEDGRRPVRIGTANDWLTVAAVSEATAAIKTDGSLWTWGRGRGNNSVLGQGDGVGRLDSPTRVGNASNWRFVAGGDEQFYAIQADGSLWAWGENEDGVFGSDSEAGSSVPIRIGTDSDWYAVSTGGEEGTLALKGDGSIWFWNGNAWTKTDVPTRIGTDNDWVVVAALRSEVATEDFAQAALKADGTVWYLGGFANGQYAFLRLGNDTDWQDLAAGESHLLAIKTDGSLWAFGDNDAAQLGDGTLNDQAAFVRVPVPGEVAAVATRFEHNVALTRDGNYHTWGENYAGQLGLGFVRTPQSTPLQVGADTNWAFVDFGQSSTVALKSDGTLWAWGQNFSGELGDGTSVGKTTPVRVGTASNWRHVAAGQRHVLAVKQDGTLWGWGVNFSGQVGVDPAQAREQLEPARIGAEQDWVSVAAGYDHSLAIKVDGSLWAWGGNDKGQLGDGTNQARFTPARIGADADWQSVTAGGVPGRSSFALKTDGSLWAWGENRAGFDFPNTDYLGVGDTTNRFQPVRIGTNDSWRAVAVGSVFKRLIKTDGTLWTWLGIKGSGASFRRVDNVAGSSQAYDTDLRDPPSFIARLVQHPEPVSVFLWNLLDPASGVFSPESQQTLANPNASLADKLSLVVSLLNVTLSQPLIYDTQRFAGVTLSAETQALLALNPTGDALYRLNRLLLDDAFPTELVRLALREWAEIAVGDNHVLGVRRDGSLWGEGSNYSGELGNGTVSDRSTFLQLLSSVREWSSVAAGQSVSAGIRTDGTLWTWGDYGNGLLGQTALLRPRAIANSTDWLVTKP